MKYTLKEIKNNDKLIAIFMNMEYIDGIYKNTYESPSFLEYSRSLDELEFSNNWNWLMGVITKIENIDLSKYSYNWEQNNTVEVNFQRICFDIYSDYVDVYEELQLDPPKEIINIKIDNTINKKNAVYHAIIETIKYYNIRTNKTQ